jgi:hypothetical protein
MIPPHARVALVEGQFTGAATGHTAMVQTSGDSGAFPKTMKVTSTGGYASETFPIVTNSSRKLAYQVSSASDNLDLVVLGYYE